MKRNIAFALVFVACVTTSAAHHSAPVVAKFGGECEGASFQPTPKLASLIRRARRRYRNPCDSAFCDGAFAYDLNGDGRQEYFLRLACGGTGNCTWGIFSDRPARLRGTFIAWFFYIHRRNASWNALSTYTREGGDQGIIATLRNRRGTYVLTSERTEHGYYSNWQPFLKRMGVPKCS
jgi:hypothetical protein